MIANKFMTSFDMLTCKTKFLHVTWSNENFLMWATPILGRLGVTNLLGFWGQNHYTLPLLGPDAGNIEPSFDSPFHI